MDGEKRAALRKVNWRPSPTCASCVWAVWTQSDWGLCTNLENRYKHNKHQRMHEMPAHKSAVCDKYKLDPQKDLNVFLNGKITS